MGKCLLLLLYPTIEDIRCKKFYVWPVAVISFVFAAAEIYVHADSLTVILTGCLPGLLLFLVSKISRGAIGAGDAAVLTGLGSMAGWQTASELCLLALFLCSAVGLFMILVKRADKKTSLPFIPFLTAALGLMGLMGG